MKARAGRTTAIMNPIGTVVLWGAASTIIYRRISVLSPESKSIKFDTIYILGYFYERCYSAEYL